MKKLVLCATLAICSFSAVSAHATYEHSLVDIENHWAEDSIARWNSYDVMTANNNTFSPEANITRADFAVILDNLMGYNESTYNFFSDLENEYYTDSVLKLFNAGIMSNTGTTISPNSLVTREDACVMVAKALHFDAASSLSNIFADDFDISADSKGYIYTLQEKGIISGDDANMFNPDVYLTRAELASILDLSIALYANEPTTYSMDVIGTVVIHSRDAALSNMNVDGDVIIAENIGDGDLKFSNITILGSLTIKGGGENSLYFDNVTVAGTTTIDKESSTVRVVASGKTQMSDISINSNAIIKTTDLYSSGSIDSISIDYARYVDFQGSFNEITNNIPSVNLTLDGTFKNINLEESATINGLDFSDSKVVYPVDLAPTVTKPSTGTTTTPTIPDVTPEPEVVLPEGHYGLSVVQPQNGSITLNLDSQAFGNFVNIGVTPDDGYVLDYITLTYNGATIQTQSTSFIMPDYAVSISAVFKLAE